MAKYAPLVSLERESEDDFLIERHDLAANIAMHHGLKVRREEKPPVDRGPQVYDVKWRVTSGGTLVVDAFDIVDIQRAWKENPATKKCDEVWEELPPEKHYTSRAGDPSSRRPQNHRGWHHHRRLEVQF